MVQPESGKMLHNFAFLSIVVSVCAGANDDTHKGYMYSEDDGPLTWKNTFPDCGKDDQSPINLQTTKATKKCINQGLTFIKYEVLPSSMELENNGHAAQLNIDGPMSIKGAGLGGEFKILQFHFHWGSTDDKGSEHTIKKKHFPLEMHIVHYNTNNNPKDAKDYRDGLAVLSVLFELGVHNPALEKVFKELDKVVEAGSKTEVTPFAIAELLPWCVNEYYGYHGSLTTPPCSQSVDWIVFQNPNTVSRKQLIKLRKLKSYVKGMKIMDNYRPLQAVNGRKVNLYSPCPSKK